MTSILEPIDGWKHAFAQITNVDFELDKGIPNAAVIMRLGLLFTEVPGRQPGQRWIPLTQEDQAALLGSAGFDPPDARHHDLNIVYLALLKKRVWLGMKGPLVQVYALAEPA